MSNRAEQTNQSGQVALASHHVRRVPVAAPVAGVRDSYAARRESRDEQTIVVMRNDLTVIRGQAQLIKRELAVRNAIDARLARKRLDAIIASVDEATIELHHLQSSRRPRQMDA